MEESGRSVGDRCLIVALLIVSSSVQRSVERKCEEGSSTDVT
jgi:hypothetical protein